MSLDDKIKDVDVLPITAQQFCEGINKSAEIHADRLREVLDYWQAYKNDRINNSCEHYFNVRTGEYFYGVINNDD